MSCRGKKKKVRIWKEKSDFEKRLKTEAQKTEKQPHTHPVSSFKTQASTVLYITAHGWVQHRYSHMAQVQVASTCRPASLRSRCPSTARHCQGRAEASTRIPLNIYSFEECSHRPLLHHRYWDLHLSQLIRSEELPNLSIINSSL